ncbi:MAG TPA: SUMF1/EgtB/PvdO family nonheme iron enzyme [Vicinamibacterales bacterium]|nr:SUMF1/EgtB/PvdO family nonheme iron enzyme [Vicinamibacterales bacterium]
MPSRRRIPSWLLIVATVATCVAMVKLESANLFPLWRFAVQWSPEALPSSSAVPMREIASGRPVLSLTLDDADLNDPVRGILPNKAEHGRQWEREGSMSYFENSKLVFASGVGVRIHGGGSRITSPRPGFRLYFRRQYGPRAASPGVFFSPAAQPVRRIVVHDDVRRDGKVNWYFVNPLAYDIARAIGAIAPETQPVRFYLNGEYYGPFVLTERFDQRFFAAHWGYDDILLSQDEMDKLFAWVRNTRPLTMANVSERVNIDNLTRWFVAVAFSATRDAYQGPGQFLDQTKKTAGWFWVNWDMDQSFRDWNHDSYQYLLERVAEGRRGRNRAEPRAVILSQLIAEDAQYREYLKRVVQGALNHQLTDAFLMERYEHYLTIATHMEVRRLDYLPRLRRFLERRRTYFRHITEQWLNTPPSQRVSIAAPRGVRVLIEGVAVNDGYEGLYFPDLELTAEIADEHRSGFSGWTLNGRLIRGAGPLKFKAEQATQIEALFESTPARSTVSPLMPLPRGPVPPARVAWRTIPPGDSWMGCVPGDDRCSEAELPRVRITFAHPFDMLDREVSADDFRAFASTTSRQMPRQPESYADGTHPVVNVTWDEASAYCGWVGGRLPTEQEWEYAARGGLDGKLFPWGDEFTGQANGRHTLRTERFDVTAPVASFPANSFGLHDMAGNVWEWTASEFRPTHASEPGRTGYDLRTIKGGGWDNLIPRLRVSERAALSRRGRHNLYVGFRCVRANQDGRSSR